MPSAPSSHHQSERWYVYHSQMAGFTHMTLQGLGGVDSGLWAPPSTQEFGCENQRIHIRSMMRQTDENRTYTGSLWVFLKIGHHNVWIYFQFPEDCQFWKYTHFFGHTYFPVSNMATEHLAFVDGFHMFSHWNLIKTRSFRPYMIESSMSKTANFGIRP